MNFEVHPVDDKHMFWELIKISRSLAVTNFYNLYQEPSRPDSNLLFALFFRTYFLKCEHSAKITCNGTILGNISLKKSEKYVSCSLLFVRQLVCSQ